jgi:tight adherence protein B
MTLTLLALAAATVLWPAPAALTGRIDALRADRRLAPVPTKRRAVARTRPARSRSRPRGRLAAGLVALVVAISTTSVGLAAAVEFALCSFAAILVAASVVGQIVDGRRAAADAARVSLGLAVLAGELEAGASTETALRAADAAGLDIGARIDRPSAADDHLARVVVAWRFSTETGVALADLVGRVRADLSDTVAGRRDLRTAAAGPQASAPVLAALPILGVALGTAMDADPLGVLFDSAVGRLLLCLGVLLDAAGVAWTSRLVARAAR